MEIKFPDSSKIHPPHKIEGKVKNSKFAFYELAKNKIRFVNTKEFNDYFLRLGIDEDLYFRTAHSLYLIEDHISENSIDRFIKNLEIIINIDDFNIDGISYKELMPIVVEHEIYEAWLHVKRGILGKKDNYELKRIRHQLALKREFYLAEKEKIGQKLFEWRTKLDPENTYIYENTWNNAKKKLEISKPM